MAPALLGAVPFTLGLLLSPAGGGPLAPVRAPAAGLAIPRAAVVPTVPPSTALALSPTILTRPTLVAIAPRRAVPLLRQARQVQATLDEARQEAAHHQGGVGATGQLEGQARAAGAGVGAPLQLDLQVARPDEQAPVLALELEATDALDAELLGRQALVRQGALEPLALGVDGDVLEALAGQAQGAVPVEVHVELAVREDLGPLERAADSRTAVPGELRHVGGHGPVPDVRLEGVEVDQSQARGDVEEGPGEVLGLLPQVLEDRVVLSVLAGDLAAGAPVSPGAAQGALEGADTASIVVGLRAQEVAQGSLLVAQHELLRDPSLAVAQVPEALLVEVVRHPQAPDHVAVGQEPLALEGAEVPQSHLEGVAVAVLRRQGHEGLAHGDDLQLGPVERDALAPRDAHELLGHALAVLEAGHGHVAGRHVGHVRQDLGRLERGQLALGDLVDVVGARLDEDVVLEELADTEVVGSVFQAHRIRGKSVQRPGGRTLASCFRTRVKSFGRGAWTSCRLPSARGKRSLSACRVRRSIRGDSAPPRLGR